MAYTDIDDPTLYFRTKTYTGNGTNNTAYTWDETHANMRPDWLWFKNRDENQSHAAFDSIRGALLRLIPNESGAEGTENANLDSFDSNGFTVDSGTIVNGSSDKMVAWGWSAGTSFSNDASATGVGTIDSTGSINTTHGFSIISYTGNATSGATVAHGLGAVPGMIMIKNRSAGSTNWNLFHKSLTGTTASFPDLINQSDSNAKYFNNTNPTSSVFSLGNYNDANGDGNNIIAYCFAEKQGYSKFGSYTGNGNADGTFVYTGFKPAFIMTKKTSSSSNWTLLDNKRLGYNVDNNRIYVNLYDTENTSDVMDILSNGFKMRNTASDNNTSGATYIYMAFAEAPFVNSNGVPANAR